MPQPSLRVAVSRAGRGPESAIRGASSLNLFRRNCILLTALLGCAALIAPPGVAQAAVPRPRVVRPVTSSEAVPPHVLYLPTNAAARAASGGLQVLVAVHGMGGDGAGFSAPLLDQAERNGWVL